jgi:hypothetical protein
MQLVQRELRVPDSDSGFGDAQLGPTERLFRPLALSSQSSTQIDDPYTRGIDFEISRVDNTFTEYKGAQYEFVDYHLTSRQPQAGNILADADGTVRLMLRLIPSETRATQEAILFVLQREEAHEASLISGLRSGRTRSVVLSDWQNKILGHFDRCEGIAEAYTGNRYGQEISLARPAPSHTLEYWDFVRQAIDPNGIPYEQYAIVERDPATELVKTYTGWAIEPGAIQQR